MSEQNPNPPAEAVDVAIARPPGFAPRGLFYGWMMVPVATAGIICTAPGQTFGISVFLPYVRDSLGLTRTQTAGAYALGTCLAAVAMTFVGMAMDRFGLRRTLSVVVVMLAAGCVAMSAASGMATLFLAFLLLRMFGQGSLGMLSGNTLAMWFHRRLGMAMGIMATGFAAAIALGPSFNYYLIQHLGWRSAYLVLGIIVLAIMGPLLLVVYRNQPEDVGQRVDGDALPDHDDAAEHASSERAFTLRQAMATRSYWIAALCTGLFAFSVTAMILCAPSIFESRGMSNDQAAARLAQMTFAMGMTLLGGQFIAGLLADRIPLNWMLAAGTAALGVAALILRRPDSAAWVISIGILLGVAQGMIVAVASTIWVRYYGRANLGRIRGTLTTVGVALSGAGPLLVDGLYEAVGSYRGVLLGLAIAPLPVAFAALFATRPPLPAPAATAPSR